MFDVAPSELIVLGTVALLVIPPKDLPKAMRLAGYWVGRARGVARQFRAGFDDMLRDAELKEMEERWAAENERIMREHPNIPQMLPLGEMTEEGAAADPEIADMPPMLVELPVVRASTSSVSNTPAPAKAEDEIQP